MIMHQNNAGGNVAGVHPVIKMKLGQLRKLVFATAILNGVNALIVLIPAILSRIAPIADLLQRTPNRLGGELIGIHLLLLIASPVLGIIILVKKAKIRYQNAEIMTSTIMTLVACVTLLLIYMTVMARFFLALFFVIITLGFILRERDVLSRSTIVPPGYEFIFILANIFVLVAAGIGFYAWHKMKQAEK